MRSVEEVRNRLIGQITEALQRPAMWGGSDVGVDAFFRTHLGFLTWIDERDKDCRRIYALNPIRNELGLVGELAGQHFNWPDYGNEVASYYAQRFHALDYWHPSRCLNPGEWESLRASLDGNFFGRDWSESEILARCGPSSYTAGGGFTVVHAYAPLTEEPWICFDFARKLRPSECEDWLDDPRLRDVRLGEHTMTPLPFTIQSEIGREVVRDDTWRTLEPRLEDHPDKEDVDIVPVVSAIRQQLPGVRVQRIAIRHGSDMWGVWYFSWERGGPEIRLSSLVGFDPFFVNVSRPPQPADDFVSRLKAIEVVTRYLVEPNVRR